MQMKPYVDLKNITKRFPGVLALNSVNFNVMPGEIHALLGENGAGKTVLTNILSGRYTLDEGEIYIQGNKIDSTKWSARDALEEGIGMVYQDFMLVEEHTVLENIALADLSLPFIPNYNEIKKTIEDFGKKYQLDVDPEAKIWQLSVGEKQRVEIIKALMHGSKVLIMDEPTAALTPQEAEDLFKIVRRLAEEGTAIIFISHKLPEVFAICDRITVLRKGDQIGTVNISDTNERDLAKMMVGREVFLQTEKSEYKPGEPVLELNSISAISDRQVKALNNLSLTVRSGEIFGLAGVSGNGQKELAEVITGLRPIISGSIIVNGKDISDNTPRRAIKSGIGHIPDDRIGMGVVPDLGMPKSMVLKNYRDSRFSFKGIFLKKSAILKYTKDLIKKFNIKTSGLTSPVKLLSGGNLQKVIIAREISEAPCILVAVHPTQGLDVGAIEFVRDSLEKQRVSGGAILLISEDLEELMAVSDRIGVIYEGGIVDVMLTKDTSIEELGLQMTGGKHA
jgi:general nucleoside transport system ATP-binding protein